METTGYAYIGQGNAPAMMPPPTATGRPTIQTVVENNAKALSTLHSTISEFELRLGLVLEQRPAKDEDASGPMPKASQLINQLTDQGNSIAHAAHRLRDLATRLQL